MAQAVVQPIPSLGSCAVAVHAVLSSHAGRKRVCWPSVAKIAEQAGCSVRSVQRALRRLAEAGWVAIEERLREDGSRASSLYRLSPPGAKMSPRERKDDYDHQDRVLLSEAGRASAREMNEPLPGLGDDWGPVEKVNRKPVTPHERELAGAIVDEFNRQAGTMVSVESHTNMALIVGAVRDYPRLRMPHWAKVIARQLAAPWWEGPPQLRVIFSPKVLPRAIDEAREWDGGPVAAPVKRNGSRLDRAIALAEKLRSEGR